MNSLIDRPDLRALFERLADVSLNPARHSAPNARAHSESVARRARALARKNGCSPSEQALLYELGLVHDLGKALGTTSPTASVELLLASGGVDPALIELVRYHDVNLAWWTSAQRGEPPSDRAWRKLARRLDARLLVLFMVADCVDCPGGWRRNEPLVWFLERARERALVSRELVLDPGADVESARLGIDIGRVIIGGGTGPGADTEFLGGDDASALRTPPLPGAFETIAELVRRLDGRVWLVSKAGPRIERRSRLWLAERRYFEATGMARENLRFCRERRDKARHAEELGLTHFVDDRLDVLRHLEGIVPTLVLFGADRAPAFARAAPSWREVVERLGLSLPPRDTPAARAR